MFRINHLILGTTDLDKSQEFYVGLLGFQFLDAFIDTGTGGQGRILRYTDLERSEHLELLLVPFTPERLPSPQHVAVEVGPAQFEALYQRAKELGMKVRAQPALNSPEERPGTLQTVGVTYRNFYVLDPMRINVEVMTRA
jgi:catechol 2,3-dioxygenase-like lactoylglutathione lyase family enzyme